MLQPIISRLASTAKDVLLLVVSCHTRDALSTVSNLKVLSSPLAHNHSDDSSTSVILKKLGEIKERGTSSIRNMTICCGLSVKTAKLTTTLVRKSSLRVVVLILCMTQLIHPLGTKSTYNKEQL